MGKPGHFTNKGTRKYQANGPQEWGPVFVRAAGKGGREGEGIRAALAFAVAHRAAFLAFAGRGRIAAAAKPAKPAGVKPAKAKPAKAKPAKAKAKPAKAKPDKAPAAVTGEEVSS